MKPTASKPKIGNSNKDSTDDENNDTMPGLQNRGHEDSISDDDSDYNQGDDESGHRKRKSDEEYNLDDSDNKQKDQHQSFLTSTKSIPTHFLVTLNIDF